MSYFPLLSNPIKPKHPHVFTLSICLHVEAKVHRAGRSTLTRRTYSCGPGGIRTLVQQLILGHAKISMLNISGISRNIQFKAIFRLSKLFLGLLWIAGPLKDSNGLDCLIFAHKFSYIDHALAQGSHIVYSAHF